MEDESPAPSNETSPSPKKNLSANMKARMERNRQKALLLRQARIVEKTGKKIDENTNTGRGCKIIDSGGGFFIEEDDSATTKKRVKRVEEPAPTIAGDKTVCIDCAEQFLDSYLFNTFDHAVCDKCKNIEEIHKLITKTEAKAKYQLKDVDLDKREPILKFILRKNPHNPRWGEMKLFLEILVEQRAIEVHGSLEEIDGIREKKVAKKEEAQKKKYEKKMNQLRKEVRSSLYTKDVQGHEHEFGEESCKNEEDDIWMKKCKTCGYELTYEKM